MRPIFLLFLLVLSALPAQAQSVVRRVEFPQTVFEIPSSSTFSTQVLLRPQPPAGLFSYGVVCNVRGDNGVAGIVILAPTPALAFDGILGAGARGVVAETGKYSSKGSVDVFSSAKKPSLEEALGNLNITGLPDGTYALSLASYNTLGPTESVFVDGDNQALDSSLEFRSATLRVISAETPPPPSPPTVPVVVSASIIKIGPAKPDRQTGLLYQKYEITNTGNVATLFRIYITRLPKGTSVWNRQGQQGGKAYIDLPAILAPGAKRRINIAYRSPNRATIPNPKFQLVASPAANPAIGRLAASASNKKASPDLSAPSAPVVVSQPAAPVFIDDAAPPEEAQVSARNIIPAPITPDLVFAHGDVVLEFNSEVGYFYSIKYKDNAEDWQIVLPRIEGTGQRIQWIDEDLADSDPFAIHSRFYQILVEKE